MDQSVDMISGNRARAVERVRDHVVAAVDAAPAADAPFFHLVLEFVFPEDCYAAMLEKNAGGGGLPTDARPQ